MAHFGCCHAFRAELIDLCKGMDLARKLGVLKLIIQMDNLACVQILTNSENYQGECVHMVYFCKDLIIQSTDWLVKIVHIFREANTVAD